MTNVYLYGALGRKFGHRFRFEINSPGEAVRAIVANKPEFQRYLIEHSLPGYQIFIGPDPIPSVKGLECPVGQQAIKIVPVVAGAAKSPVIGILIGVAIIAAAVALGPAGFGVIATWGTVVAVGSIGAGLVIGGISQLIAGAPKAPEIAERPENRPSNIFNGPVNTMAQGHPVPIGYGRLRIGSAVISAGITTVDIPV
jgi:predicted phage tail protein